MSVIILVGFMGCGKTTLGRKLARQLDYTFVDADDAIEERYKISVKDIFAKFGETHFRKLEREFILSLKDQENIVLSTGGGMPCFGDNMQMLNEIGITFYLQRSVGELASRLINAKKPRPLIIGKNYDELVAFIADLLPEREVFYLQAEHILNREQQTPVFMQFLLQRDSNTR